MTEKQSAYKKYITSPEWYSLKIDLLKIRGCKCEKCGRPGRPTSFHIHHLTYEHLFNEDAKDLMVLCGICHMKEHGLFKEKVKRKRRIKKTGKKQKNTNKAYEEKLRRIEKGYKNGVYKTFAAYMRAKTKASI